VSWFPRVVVAYTLLVAVVNGAKPVAAYRVIALEGGAAEVGLVAASFGLLALFAAIIAGPMVDRMTGGGFLVGGMLGMVAATLWLAVADSIVGLAIGMCVLGVAMMFAQVSLQALVANAGDPADRDRRFATQSMFASLGQLTGPAVAGVLITLGTATDASAPSLESTSTFFLVASAAATAAAVLALSLWKWPAQRVERIPTIVTGHEGRGAGIRRVLQTRTLPQAIVASMSIPAAVDLLAAYLPLLGAASGLPPATVGLLLSTRALASLGSRAAFGVLVSRVNRRTLMIGSLVVPALATAALPLAAGTDLALVFAIVFVMGIGLGIGSPLTLVWVASKAPSDLRATALGLRLSGNRLAQVAVPGVAAVVAVSAVGVAAPFVVVALLLLTAAALTATADLDDSKSATAAAGASELEVQSNTEPG
jgi:MFS family permease